METVEDNFDWKFLSSFSGDGTIAAIGLLDATTVTDHRYTYESMVVSV